MIFDCTQAQEYKLGAHNPPGRAFIRHETEGNPVWLVCDMPATAPGDVFAQGHNFEVFNSGDCPYGEAEWRARAGNLRPGESLDFTQTFTVQPEASALLSDALAEQEQELVSCMSS